MKKRICSLLLVLALLCGSMCIAAAEETFDPRSVTEGVTLVIAVPEDVEVPDWENNLTTLAVEEALGVKLDFQVYSAADYLDKISVMVNGGDKLPDIIFNADDNSINSSCMKWAAEEAIIPLNDFLANPAYCPNITEAIEKSGVNFPALLADADGNIWAMPRYFESPTNEVPSKFWYNGKWAKELGFDSITTTEDFYQLCKAFKAAGDINGNGQDDEYCISGYANNFLWFNCLMNSFVYATDDHWIDVEDGQLRFAFMTEEWKEGLKYLRKFFEEGLIDSTIFTQDSAANTAMTNAADPGLLSYFGYYVSFSNPDIVAQNQIRSDYTYIPSLKGPKGTVEGRYNPTVTTAGAVITADCENPLAAFIVMDYLCSEEQTITWRYGQRGVDWDYWQDVTDDKLPEGLTKADYVSSLNADEDPYVIAYSDGTYWGKGNPQMAGYMQAGPAVYLKHVYYNMAKKNVAADENEELGLWLTTRNYQSILDCLEKDCLPAETIVVLPMTTAETDEAYEIQTVLDSYVKESIGYFLLGTWDIDTYWDTYMAELETIGATRALELYQTSYDRTK